MILNGDEMGDEKYVHQKCFGSASILGKGNKKNYVSFVAVCVRT